MTTEDIEAVGQPVRIANSAYTIVANFDSALTVTVPIYCWGTYTITCANMDNRKAVITPDKYDYLVTFGAKTIYSYGYNPYNLTKTYANGGSINIFTKQEDLFKIQTNTSAPGAIGCTVVTSDTKIDLTQYNSIEVTYGIYTNTGYASAKIGLILPTSPITHPSHVSVITEAVSNATVVTDISSRNGEHFIGISSWVAAGKVGGEVKEIILR